MMRESSHYSDDVHCSCGRLKTVVVSPLGELVSSRVVLNFSLPHSDSIQVIRTHFKEKSLLVVVQLDAQLDEENSRGSPANALQDAFGAARGRRRYERERVATNTGALIALHQNLSNLSHGSSLLICCSTTSIYDYVMRLLCMKDECA